MKGEAVPRTARKSSEYVPPGSMIGILGGGQLGRMMAMAAAQLGYRCHVFTDKDNSPAADVSAQTTVAPFDDMEALDRFARSVAVATYEFEHIPLTSVERVAARVPVRPGINALAVAQDRLSEKTFLRDTGIDIAPFEPVDDADALKRAVDRLGLPCVAKRRLWGYDGKGQTMIRRASDIKKAAAMLEGTAGVVEGFVDFEREVSVIIARTGAGDISAYPLCHNIHAEHVLRETRVPSGLPEPQMAQAKVMATRIANALDYVGLLTVEMFSLSSGGLVVNELAPRVHNSGHWTIEGAITSQFEQHIRAICGLPLGCVRVRGPVRMRNLLGTEIDRVPTFLSDPGAHVHDYGKGKPVPGRKMGHVTWVDAQVPEGTA